MTDSRSADFETILSRTASDVDSMLHVLLSDHPLPGEIARPHRLMEAIRHGVLAGGKRLRPFLVIETAAMFGVAGEAVMRVAAAVECLHCYSLVHDDLPAMDDDDMRRGRPTVHRAFDEATAILAGDALLTMTFDIIASPETDLAPGIRAALVSSLARAAGAGGMVGGQALDLAAASDAPDEAGIITLQAMKTGALIRFSCEAGAIVAGASDEDRERLAEFGAAIGLAFQLADDLLDLTAHPETVGKATGKDGAAGKATLASLHGIDWARDQLHGLVEQASSLLQPYGGKADILRNCARFVAQRKR